MLNPLLSNNREQSQSKTTMKRIFHLSVITALVILCSCQKQQTEEARNAEIQPREAQGSRDWRPYTDGHWVYTDVGWTWVSEEPFGWATYHYGRWTRLRNIGWVWVPGDEWAPAWVSWRKNNDYVGWAPLPPEAQFDRRSGI